MKYQMYLKLKRKGNMKKQREMVEVEEEWNPKEHIIKVNGVVVKNEPNPYPYNPVHEMKGDDMNEPTKEQSKEFWGGCGFYWVVKKELMRSYVGHLPASIVDTTGHWEYEGYVSKNFPGMFYYSLSLPLIDLHNLWKYAIPQLCKEYRNWHSLLHDWVDQCTGDLEKDTLSLFWALYPILTREKILWLWVYPNLYGQG